MMSESFSWIPLYRELAVRLAEWEDRQSELISFLEQLRADGYKVTPLNDRDADGNPFLMQEIDPFTFFGAFNRQIRDEQRIAILTALRERLGAQMPLPTDFDGVPVVNNQRSWFFAYHFRRGPGDVAKLWQVFRLALLDDPWSNAEFLQTFDDACQIWGVATNLTMGLFWIRPDVFVGLDALNRAYLQVKLPPGGLNAAFYRQVVQTMADRGQSPAQISLAAWQATQYKKEQAAVDEVAEIDSDGLNYWLMGAYWEDSDPQDQTARFLAEGIWQNGYQDKYLDDVRSVNVGDRIAIKVATTRKLDLPFDAGGRTVSRLTIKAAGTVVANRGDGRTLEVDWDKDFQSKDWYFFTYRRTVWRLPLDPGEKHREYSELLVRFIWHNQPQDYEWFCSRWWTEAGEITDQDSVAVPYGVDNIIAEGVFLQPAEIQRALDRLQARRNLVLQGAPGVGKTFLAQRLAYAFMQEKARDRVQMIQFHQNYSYEDFVRGYRPDPEKPAVFHLQDGVFFKFCEQARKDPEQRYVFIIDEINRGNLSQIFGELLMLIEADKRNVNFAVPLAYHRPQEPEFWVPPNVYLLGLMNVADRSLALVDYALRRRFAFLTLPPQYSSATFRQWLDSRGMDSQLIERIIARMTVLNDRIAQDPLLGPNYQIGHSFFCPAGDDFSSRDTAWYDDIVHTEILPLLREYWFDQPQQVKNAEQDLLTP